VSKTRSLLIRLYTPLVASAPDVFFSILKRRHLELIINRLEIGSSFGLSSATYPPTINGFEDLAFLFWPTPVNRGILRQDIDEAAALYRTISRMKNPRGVEIGRFSGGSTILLAAAVGSLGKLVSIDIDPQDDQLLSNVLARYSLLERVKLMRGDANDVLLEDDLPYDFILIDGDHSYEGAKRDHNKWGAKVKASGYIIHHDMSASRAHATQHRALARLKNDILSVQANDVKLVEEAGSMSFFQRQTSAWTGI
jgi:predicted O-methyltransferase YrrM